MRTMSLLFGSMVAVAAASAMAETTVSDVTVRQNWPWSGDVDIAFTLGGDKSDVSVSATWDGQSEPVVLDADLGVNLADLLPGKYTVRWTPPANTPLPGFRVNVSPVGFAARKYLVVDLRTGAYEFRAEPDENWKDNAYRTTKMAFARIPAGIYTLGLTDAQLKTVFPDGSTVAALSPVDRQKTRTVKVTHDYYMGCFLVSSGQITSATNTAYAGTGMSTPMTYYNLIRGSVADGINWPTTKHAVSEGSILGGFRRKLSLPKGWVIDLPSSAQFEIAARCGTTSLFPDESLGADSTEQEYVDYLNSVTWWGRHKPPAPYTNTTIPCGYGTQPNAWGVYEMLGFRVQIVADWYIAVNSFKGWPTETMVDPVGPDTANNRENRSVGMSAADAEKIGGLLPTRIAYSNVATGGVYFRFCINTHSLFGE